MSTQAAAPASGATQAGQADAVAATAAATGAEVPTPNATATTPAAATPATPAPTPAPAASSFTQADIDKAKADAVAAERAATKSKQQQEQAKASGNWEQLANDRERELVELKPQADAAKRYADHINKLIDGEIKDWSDEIKSLDPGKESLDARMAFVERSRALAARLKILPFAPNTEAGAGNQPAAQPAAGAAASTGAGTPAPNVNATKETFRFQQPGDVSW